MRLALHRTVAVGCTMALSLVLFACGDDDGADVRDLGGEDSGSGSGSASGSASGPASGKASGSASGPASGSVSGSASGTAAAEAECTPVNEDLESAADSTIEVGLDEYAFDPSEISVDAGTVTFAATNNGEEAHELAFLPGGGDIPSTDDGAPDEDALAELEAFELEAFGPGQDCNATWELEAGEYTMFCIVEAPDGETHADKGMVGSLTVG